MSIGRQAPDMTNARFFIIFFLKEHCLQLCFLALMFLFYLSCCRSSLTLDVKVIIILKL